MSKPSWRVVTEDSILVTDDVTVWPESITTNRLTTRLGVLWLLLTRWRNLNGLRVYWTKNTRAKGGVRGSNSAGGCNEEKGKRGETLQGETTTYEDEVDVSK